MASRALDLPSSRSSELSRMPHRLASIVCLNALRFFESYRSLCASILSAQFNSHQTLSPTLSGHHVASTAVLSMNPMTSLPSRFSGILHSYNNCCLLYQGTVSAFFCGSCNPCAFVLKSFQGFLLFGNYSRPSSKRASDVIITGFLDVP